ncbi:GNAT family N-acetyltransferase [Streptomyces sp. NBC_01465]|uniref:GNAT family N-acetyltransferase n=1 Tax=Streptomyces sp. NBC_01465 TaxID=2903878 RepID=UPI002E34752C|nr:GNAT family N-acetyltransferase [Streptomyces sp. NBC_01465]
MREIHSTTALPADELLIWAARDLTTSRAWRSADGGAYAVAAPDLCRRDRLAVSGPPGPAITLVRELLPDLGPTYRPLGDAALVGALAAAIPALTVEDTFGWMSTAAAVPVAGDKAEWLSEEAHPEITALLAEAFPSSAALPGIPGVESWAGVRDDDGTLLATAALAWSSPTVGLLTGVAVHPSARGRGLARTVCAHTLNEALARHGTAALMVDGDNASAIGLYARLGLSYRELSAAASTASTATAIPRNSV